MLRGKAELAERDVGRVVREAGIGSWSEASGVNVGPACCACVHCIVQLQLFVCCGACHFGAMDVSLRRLMHVRLSK